MLNQGKKGIFLLLGTNEGNRRANLSNARLAIVNRVGSIVNASSIYRTEAWGKVDQPEFYNQVIEIGTTLSPQELLKEILLIEQMQGRVRGEKWGSRIIDIDILFYNDAVIDEDDLQIPHPGIAVRRFTLIPLNEIAGELMHPILHKTIEAMLKECPDVLQVTPTSASRY